MHSSLIRRLRRAPGLLGQAAVRTFGSRFATSDGGNRHLARAIGYWDRQASDDFANELGRISWTGIPQVHANQNGLITGNRDIYWVPWIRERFFSGGSAGDVLSLGCGAGHLDRILQQSGFLIRSLTGIDISPRSTERAQQLAEQIELAPRVTYLAEDLNTYTLPPRSYDFIYFFQSLHHIEALEHILGQCQAALRPSGLLMVNEFVGPSRFQWTRPQVDLANALIGCLPAELRVELHSGKTKTAVVRPTVAEMVSNDPTEAVRSGEIEGLLKRYFDVIEEWNWGGTLNHLVFQDIAWNFDQQNSYHRSVIELLIHHENVLIRERVLPSDFKVFLARLPARAA